MDKLKDNVIPICHFTEMEECFADNGNGGVEEWFECLHCGHTKEIGTQTIGA